MTAFSSPSASGITPEQSQPATSRTPRRGAISALTLGGAALLGLAGGSQGSKARGKGKAKFRSEKKKKKKSVPTPAQTLSIVTGESEPFSLGAGEQQVVRSACPAGYSVISGGLDTESITNCAIQESAPWSPTEWFIDLRCDTGGSATDAVAKAICIKLA